MASCPCIVASRYLDDAASDKPRPASDSPRPQPGTVLVREWHGTLHEVTVLHKGYRYHDRHASFAD